MVKDSDTCLQTSPGWSDYYICNSTESTKYCNMMYAKDMKRCCPDSCGTGALSEEECYALGGWGNCIYPNEAQCSSAARKLIFQCTPLVGAKIL